MHGGGPQRARRFVFDTPFLRGRRFNAGVQDLSLFHAESGLAPSAAPDPDRPLLPPRVLALEHVCLDLALDHPDALFDAIAERLARPHGPTVKQIRTRLQGRHAREAALGPGGLAMPHAAVPALGTASAAYLRFREPLRRPDGTVMVDALALLVPLPGLGADHALLLRLQRELADARMLRALRRCADAAAVHRFFTRWR